MKFLKVELVLCVGVLLAANAVAQERSDFVSDASHTVGTYEPAESDFSIASQTSAANALLKSLDEDLRKRIVHDIDSRERREWTNLPAPQNAGGVRLGDMNEKQVKATCDLLASLMSQQGYQKMVGIMLADDQLLNRGRARPGFGTENFSIVIFGEPSETKPWGIQLDGHHVGVNIAVEGEKYSMSPSFIGTQPQSFELAGKTIRPLTGEIDEAYTLVNSLSDPQRKKAVVRDSRGQIIAGPGNDTAKLEKTGLSCSELTDKQKEMLFGLVTHWVKNMPEAQAEIRMKQIREEIDQAWFEWNGQTEVGSDISYRIHCPSLIIEYACQSLGGDPQQHLHTMYRDPTNEYGLQLEER